ncbi:MAG: hypothetical protein ACI85O_001391 [Saprospiraceae bacterium]
MNALAYIYKKYKSQKTLEMISKKLAFFLLLINIIVFTSCNQEVNSNSIVETIPKEAQPKETKERGQHPYGGWSCPDNVLGFPAVDIQELDKIPIINGRLPTKEETQNGTSLMYFDPAKHPDAQPLDITFPKLARYYSKYTKKNELVIVIQAVVEEGDTVAGFRYLNGGNGSDWYSELNFISEEEIDKLGSTPFVSQSIELKASKERIWGVITSPNYEKKLGAMFDKGASIESDWKQDSEAHFKYEPNKIVNTGIITALWKNMYLQIDYNLDGYHYAEKILLLENKDNNTIDLHVVSGPYGEDFEVNKVVWENWLQKIKELSEGK